jgi:outer membrane lipoprotein-sorting protein
LRADPPASTPPLTAPGIDYKAKNQDPRARALLDEAKAKLMGLHSLVVDYAVGLPSRNFDRQGQISLERPNLFMMEDITGFMEEIRKPLYVCDGQTVADLTFAGPGPGSVAFHRKVHDDNFFLGTNPFIQFFFDPAGIAFDPAAALWRRPISQFDTNKAAYDKNVTLTLLGPAVLEGRRYDVVEIKYNTERADIRQQIYVGEDKFVYEIVTTIQEAGRPLVYGFKYRNYRTNAALPESTWHQQLGYKVTTLDTDPARLGTEPPDFHLPGYNGGQFGFKELIKGRKGALICAIPGAAGRYAANPDKILPMMKVLQQMKDKFEKQGLLVVGIVGGMEITPDVVKEMKLNWMPDVSRFNYPIVIDVDLERGIQGTAFWNFQMQGRSNLLLDRQGKVVFASGDLTDTVNNLALYQALAQIGFVVSPADLEDAAK